MDPTAPSESTSELIEMTDWELHDFAMQVVRTYIEKKLKRKVTSYCSNPELEPSMWFEGDKGIEWVSVRAVRYPKKSAPHPASLLNTKEICRQKGYNTGHFASVAVSSADDVFDGVNVTPLWRRHGMHVVFEGLEEIL